MKYLPIALFLLVPFIYALPAKGQSGGPENLGPTVNSSYDDINPVLSPDGKILYFTRVNHPENTFGEENSEDIWFAELQPDGAWSQASRLPTLNIGRYNAVLGVFEDGSLLLNGIYNKKGTTWKKRGLSVTMKEGDTYSAPKALKIPGLSKQIGGLKSSGSLSQDGSTIVMSYSKMYNSKKSSLFVIEKSKKGKWTRPKMLHDLNLVKGSEDTPFLAADNKTLYYSIDPGTGLYDIYKVTKQGDWKTWSDKEKLESVSSGAWDAYFRLSPDERWGYYSSESNTMGGADIFRVRMDKRDTYVVVEGKIRHAQSNRLLFGKDIQIFANGRQADSVEVWTDSAAYHLVLEAGKAYKLSAEIANFKGISEVVDLSNPLGGAIVNKDLRVEPLPYVLVKGIVMNKSTGKAIPGRAHPVIHVNEAPLDSILVDSLTGAYEMKLPFGKSYIIHVAADGYQGAAEQLDLTQVDEYQVMHVNLGGSKSSPVLSNSQPKPPEPEIIYVTVKGTIVDQRTGEPLVPAIPVQIRSEETGVIEATINPETRNYELQLEAGKTYILSASAPRYFSQSETIVTQKNILEMDRDLIVVPIQVGQLVRLNNIFFETGKASLKKESFPELNRVASFLKDNPGINIEIRGHTDNVGSADMNQKLSELRAGSVRAYIISKGITPDQLSSKGFGLSLPVATNQTEEGRAKNRRVEFGIVEAR